MTLKTQLLSAAWALLLSAGAATAAPATAESAVNMRSGPGAQYEVIATIPGGATVDVAGCTGSWCQVSFNGASGFANRSYLAMGSEPSAAIVAPGYAYDDAPLYADDTYDGGYTYGPGFSFYVNPRHRFHHRGNWNGGQAGAWQNRPGWNGTRTGAWQSGGNRTGNATINRTPGIVTPQVSAPAGLRRGGGGVFRGGAAAGGGVSVGGGGAGVFHGGAGAVGRAQGH